MDKMRELLAGCLREDANGYMVQALVSEFPTVQELMNANEEEIKLIKGISAVKARQLNAILGFIKSINAPNYSDKVIIRNPGDIYNFMRAELEYLNVERFAVIGLSTRNHVVFKEIVSSGSLNASLVHPRETFRSLIRRSCASCILVHNHPSGDATPSQEDIVLTKQLVEGGKLLGIPVLDHVIIGQGRYISLKERGLIN